MTSRPFFSAEFFVTELAAPHEHLVIMREIGHRETIHMCGRVASLSVMSISSAPGTTPLFVAASPPGDLTPSPLIVAAAVRIFHSSSNRHFSNLNVFAESGPGTLLFRFVLIIVARFAYGREEASFSPYPHVSAEFGRPTTASK